MIVFFKSGTLGKSSGKEKLISFPLATKDLILTGVFLNDSPQPFQHHEYCQGRKHCANKIDQKKDRLVFIHIPQARQNARQLVSK